jgi:hypothetical protein
MSILVQRATGERRNSTRTGRTAALRCADLTSAYVELIVGIRSGALNFEGGHPRVEPRTSLDDVLRPRLAG